MPHQVVETMKQAILDGLEPAKQAHATGTLDYRGGGTALYRLEDSNKKRRGPHVTYMGERLRLPDDMYDLRAVLHFLARENRAGHWTNIGFQPSDAYRVAFYRATRALFAEGTLIPLTIATTGYRAPKEVRFVRRA